MAQDPAADIKAAQQIFLAGNAVEGIDKAEAVLRSVQGRDVNLSASVGKIVAEMHFSYAVSVDKQFTYYAVDRDIKLQNSVTHYRRALELQKIYAPQLAPQSEYNLACDLAFLKHSSEAVALFQGLLRNQPMRFKREDVLFQIAFAYFVSADDANLPKALDDAFSANENSPAWVRVLLFNARASYFSRQGDWPNCLNSCNSGLALDPENTALLSTLNESQWKQGKWDEAIASAQKLVKYAKDNISLGIAQHTLGFNMLEAGRPDLAIRPLELSLPLLKVPGQLDKYLGASRDLMRACAATGTAENGFKVGLAAMKEVASISDPTIRSRQAGMVLYHYADIWSQVNPTEATKIFSWAARESAAANDTKTRIRAEQSIALCLVNTGRVAEALALATRLTGEIDKLGDPVLKAQQELAFGGICWLANEPAKALEHTLLALEFSATSPFVPRVTCLVQLSRAYLNLGLYEEAEKRLLEAEELLSKANRSQFITVKSAISDYYIFVGRWDKAIECAQRALQVAAHDPPIVASLAVTQLTLGTALQKAGQLEKAKVAIADAIAFARRAHQRSTLSAALVESAALDVAEGRMDSAKASLNEALFESLQSQQIRDVSAILGWQAWLHQRSKWPGHLEQSVLYGKLATRLASVYVVRGSNLEFKAQSGLTFSVSGQFRGLCEALALSNREPEIIDVVDAWRNRSRVPEDFIVMTNAERQASELFFDWISSTRQEQLSVRSEADLAEPLQNPQLTTSAQQLRSSFNRMMERVESLVSQSAEAPTPPMALAKLQRNLADINSDAGTLFIVSSLEGFQTVLVTSSGTYLKRGELGDQDLTNKIKQFGFLIRTGGETKAIARKLYDDLLKGLDAPLSECKHLFLVCDGPSRALPFAALFDGKQYAVEKWSLSYLEPGDLERLTKPPTRPPRFEVFGLTKAPNIKDFPFQKLEGAEWEARVIAADHLAKPRWDTDFVPSTVAAALSNHPSVVHFATHFQFMSNERDSFMVTGAREPWKMREIQSMPDNAFDGVDLVTISACATAKGIEAPPHILETLGQSAIRKGAQAAVTSLWKVDDGSTGPLMRQFYRNWRSFDGPVAKAKALQSAQLAMLRGDLSSEIDAMQRSLNHTSSKQRPIHLAKPYYWAPFVLIGNAR